MFLIFKKPLTSAKGNAGGVVQREDEGLQQITVTDFTTSALTGANLLHRLISWKTRVHLPQIWLDCLS